MLHISTVLGKDVTDLIYYFVHRLSLQAVNKEFCSLIMSINEDDSIYSFMILRCKARPAGFVFGNRHHYRKGREVCTWNTTKRRRETQIIQYST